ncbi:cytochrome c biogenesis protein CcsA [uncultured Fibrobacter sp.]|uniref:cytochrome c biogenesis protein n=1 Tax=uncultured Fibrobacter sp. TaxID=261512 RepID=UPI002608D034|nr:cytochrome c biogenesis protein CcsA [uncultured Fibrobacter sp.]
MASLKVSAALLVAFMLLTFWGVLAQANAKSLGASVEVATDRFFGSYFVWAVGYIPLPAFKSVAALGVVHLVLCLIYRMPRGWCFAGLWLMHIALIVLLLGSLVGSEIKREYNGYAIVPAEVAGAVSPLQAEVAPLSGARDLRLFLADDSLGLAPVEIDEQELKGGWPYFVQYRGYAEMAPGKNVAMYKVFYDPFHFVPYVFMVMFLLGAALHYFVKVRGNKVHGDSVGVAAKVLPLLALLFAALPMDARASARPVPVLEALHSDTPVLVDGVVRPFDSFARGFLDDLSGRVTYKCRKNDSCMGKISAAEIVRQAVLTPEKAHAYALFKVFRGDVSEALHLPSDSRYVSYVDLALSRDLLDFYASRNDDHPATAEMKRLYGNVRLYESVVNHSAFSVVGEDVKFRLSLEVLYHHANLALWGFAAAFLACLLSALNMIFRSKKLDVAANGLCVATAVMLTVMFAVRTFVAARPPMSSLYEIVLLVALLLMAFESVAFFRCKNRTYALILPITMMTAVLLFFAKFVLEPGDTFRPIPEVLNSSVFLTLHVFTIALGFAGMILSGVVAHLVLFRISRTSNPEPRASNLDRLLYGTLAFGGAFTILGTLLGGVWADFAWGRFWGFDPKECGALFVILWAMLLLHLRAGRLVSPRGFALLCAFSSIVTFLCWFGINLLGVGLHSYGFQGGTAMWLIGFVVVDTLAIVAIAKRGARGSSSEQ